MKRLCLALVAVCLIALPALAQQQKSWEIVRADYGSGQNWIDVTERVRSLVQSDALDFAVNASTLGAETRRGRNRALRLQLIDRRGRTQQLTFRENQQVRLRIRNSNSGGLQITRAIYGSGSRTLDVTTRLRQQIQGGQLDLVVSNLTMGGDPAPRRDKSLTVDYTLNGRAEQRVIREGETIRLGEGAVTSSALHISNALYGSGNRTYDVTARLRSQIYKEQLNLQVNNQTMGGDPAPGQEKALTLRYALNGRSDQIVVQEGATLRLPSAVLNNSALHINSAFYGAGSRTNNVTSRVSAQIYQDQVNLAVTNQTMGGDPAPGQNKTLRVRYAVNGREEQVEINEGATLRLPFTTSDLSQRIRCESVPANGYGRQYCAANTRGGVRLTRNLGEAECVQNSNWGYDSSGVWVDRGCRAEFELQAGNQPGQSADAVTSATIPRGTELSVRTNEKIDSKSATAGQTYAATIAADVLNQYGAITIPRGSDAQLVIRSTSGGNVASSSDLVLDVTSLTVAGRHYLVSTDDISRDGGQGVGANRKTAIMVGGGAALGTLIGAMVGGGKGAAIGAAIGAGAGLGTQVLTRGDQVQVPVETVLNFRLDQDLYLQAIR